MNVKRVHLRVMTLIGWRSRPTIVKGSGIFKAGPAESPRGVPTAGAETVTIDVTIRKKRTFVDFKFMLSYAMT